MADNLFPKHYVFARWFIRLRWIAVIFLACTTFFIRNYIQIPIHAVPIYELTALLLLSNVIYLLLLKRTTKKDPNTVLPKIKRIIHFQISFDLLFLTLMLHYSGGIENPLIIYYIFHMIIAASIFPPLESYAQTCLALLLIAALTFLECYGLIPHYTLRGFVPSDLYLNKPYLFGAGFVFMTTSFMVVTLMNLIISRSLRNEEAYINANLELEKKDKLKNEYVFRVTHDIKGHLAAISSCLKVINSGIFGKPNDKQEEFLTRAYERTELLTTFVKDLLNLTKKRLRNESTFGTFSLREIIEKVATTVRILAKDKSIEFDLFMDAQVDKMEGDPYSIEELFSNLLFNAIKYTQEKGHVELYIKNRPDSLVAIVSDNGIGIPEKDIPNIFEEFFRAGNVSKDKSTGSGLGLSIVKQIVDNHKGKINVKSEQGLGTKFTVILPKSQKNPIKNLQLEEVEVEAVES